MLDLLEKAHATAIILPRREPAGSGTAGRAVRRVSVSRLRHVSKSELRTAAAAATLGRCGKHETQTAVTSSSPSNGGATSLTSTPSSSGSEARSSRRSSTPTNVSSGASRTRSALPLGSRPFRGLETDDGCGCPNANGISPRVRGSCLPPRDGVRSSWARESMTEPKSGERDVQPPPPWPSLRAQGEAIPLSGSRAPCLLREAGLVHSLEQPRPAGVPLADRRYLQLELLRSPVELERRPVAAEEVDDTVVVAIVGDLQRLVDE